MLSLKTEQLQQERFTVTEQKTGKKRRIRLPEELRKNCLKISGDIFIFPHRLNKWKHRTRQAVWKDLRKASTMLRLKGNASPHSLRKTYARTLQKEGFSLSQIQKALNHSDPTLTAVYIMADELAMRE